MELWCPCSLWGSWTRWSLNVPSNSKDSMIVRYTHSFTSLLPLEIKVIPYTAAFPRPAPDPGYMSICHKLQVRADDFTQCHPTRESSFGTIWRRHQSAPQACLHGVPDIHRAGFCKISTGAEQIPLSQCSCTVTEMNRFYF